MKMLINKKLLTLILVFSSSLLYSQKLMKEARSSGATARTTEGHINKKKTTAPAQADPNMIRIKVTEDLAKRLSANSFARTGSGNVRTGLSAFDAQSEQLEIIELKRVFPDAGKYEKAHRHYGLHLWYEATLARKTYKQSIQTAMTSLSSIQGIEKVEAKYNYSLGSYSSRTIDMASSSEDILEDVPNDRFFDAQWHYDNNGQSGGTPGSDIRLRYAWTQTTGYRDVIVSIHDGGVDTRHEDLAANMWINTTEKNGRSGVDDDNNGFIDDIHGFNFVNHSGVIIANDHGTHVAGTVGAVTNNGKGVAGVAGGSGLNDGVRMMSTQVFTNTSGGGFENSFLYAADNGAVISQNSWSGASEPSQALIDAIDYFIARAGYDNTDANFPLNIQTGPMAGGLVVFAAGNYHPDEDPNEEVISYPGALPQVLCVANTNHHDHKDVSSLWYDAVDVSAPGTEIASTFPSNQYGYLTGTSMACPHVSGVAALILSKYKDQGITPDDIRHRIIDRVSSINHYEPNLPFAGKMGSGRLNAFQALIDDDHTAPSTITTLGISSFDAVSVTLTWRAPQDGAMPAATIYEVRYHSEPITAENFESATLVARQPVPGFAGSMETFTVNDLESNATYYFAIQASDYFGNTSAISNVVSQKTLAAPFISVDPLAFNVEVDAQGGVAQFPIIIANEGAANLDYTLTPTLQGKVTLEKGDPSHNTPDDVLFAGAGGGTFITATRFQAPEEGFDLLGIESFYRTYDLTSQQSAVEVTILRGGTTPDKGVPLKTLTIKSLSKAGRWQAGILDESLHFNGGETFWVKLSYSELMTFPQAMDDMGNEPGTFYFTTNGTSWTDIQTLDGFQSMHLKVKAVDDFQWLTINPVNGTAAPEAINTHNLNIDPTELVNGVYSTSVNIASNDPRTPVVEVPVNVTIVGGVPEIEVSMEPISYGDVFVGGKKTHHLEIRNVGQDNLEVALNFTPADAVFSAIPSSIVLEGRTAVQVPVIFSPAALGEVTAQLTIVSTDTDEGEINISLRGTGIPAPVMVITPEPLQTTIESGATGTLEFTIENQGGNNLEFEFTNQLPVAGLSGEDGTFGYHWVDSRQAGGPVYQWNDISQIGTALSVADDGAVRVELPFEFPFYAETKTEVLISPNGFLTFGSTTGATGGRMIESIPSANEPNDLIAIFWTNLDVNKKGASIHYLQEGEKFTVQYTNMPAAGQGLSGTATFQVVLYPDGNIEYYYKDIVSSPLLAEYVAGIENAEGTDGMLLAFNSYDFLVNELAVRISPTKDFIITGITPLSGTVEPGGTTNVTLQLNAAKLMAGLHIEQLMGTTNDPLKESLSLPVALDVTGEALPVIQESTIDFDTVYVGFNKTMNFTITNNGRRTLTLADGVVNGSTNYSLNEWLGGIEIHPGASKSFGVTYAPAEEIGEEPATLTITTDAGDLIVDLTAKGVLPPLLTTAPPIEVTLEPGTSLEQSITLLNDGASKLKYSFTSFESQKTASSSSGRRATTEISLRADKTQADTREGMAALSTGGSVANGYHWIDNTQPGGPVFNWEELGHDPNVQIIKLADDGMDEVSLPFTFNFFGKPYNSMFVTDNGVIGFDSQQLSNTWNYRPMPTQTGNTHSFLAPFWFDFLPSELKPAKIYVKKESDHVTVQFEEAQQVIETPFFTIILVNTFQAILYADGSVKYQYQVIQTDNSGSVGIEDHSGTEGLSISFNDDYLRSGLAILITPYNEMITDLAPTFGNIDAGSEAVVNYTVSAPADAVENIYTQMLALSTNDPLNNVVLIPVKVKVAGKADIKAPYELNFGQVIKNESASMHLVLENPGTKPFVVESLQIDNDLFVTDITQPVTIAAGDLKVFAITFSGSETVGSQTGKISVSTNIESNSGSLKFDIPVTVNITEAPAFKVPAATMKWTMQKDDTHTEDIQIENLEGGDLHYSLSAVPYSSDADDYKHEGEPYGTPEGRARTGKPTALPMARATSLAHADLTPFAGNIFYDPEREPDSFLGTDGYIDSKLNIATRFVVEEEYFALTHALVHYKFDYFSDLPVKLSVAYGGQTPASAGVIHEVQFMHEEARALSGVQAIIPLDTTLFFAESDTIWLMLEYPGAAGKAQAIHLYADNTDEKYFYYDDQEKDWLDANVLFPGLAFKVRALQQKVDYIMWAQPEDKVKAANKKDVSMIISSAGLDDGIYESRTRLETNDPSHPLHTILNTMEVAVITSAEGDREFEFFLAPNPAKDKVRFTLMPNEEVKQAALVSLTGQSQSVQASAGNDGQASIDLSPIKPGLYVLKIVTDKSVYTNRLVISR